MSRHHHVPLHDHVRRAALKRAGYRSERNGKAGRLECHHLHPLSQGGEHLLENVVVLTRDEHLAIHRPSPDPDRQAWAHYLEEVNA